MKVKNVIFFTNGNVIVFGINGKQIPQLQGFIFEKARMIVEHCDENTKFKYSKWQEGFLDCDFSWWFKRRDKDENR